MGLQVARRGAGVVAHRRSREEEGEQVRWCAPPGPARPPPAPPTRGRRRAASRARVQAPVGGVVEQAQRREAGGGGERVARERAGLVDVARRRHQLHEVRAARRRPPPGRPPPMILPSTVRSGVTPSRCWAPPRATRKPGDHLVEHEQRARCVGGLAQEREEPRLGRDQAHVGRVGLAQERGHLAARRGRAPPRRGRSRAPPPCRAAWAAVTPGLAGMPCVARPEPASASRPSTWPW